MKGFEPSLLERLLDDEPKLRASTDVFKSVSLEQYKESVARDLEGLLNTRSSFDDEALKAFPNCQKSLMTYGLGDFSGMSLANAYDRAAVCRSIGQAIARHEPRLVNVRVTLSPAGRSISALHFTIHGLLNLQPAREPISFDALLQTHTRHYSVSRMRRIAHAG